MDKPGCIINDHRSRRRKLVILVQYKAIAIICSSLCPHIDRTSFQLKRFIAPYPTQSFELWTERL